MRGSEEIGQQSPALRHVIFTATPDFLSPTVQYHWDPNRLNRVTRVFTECGGFNVYSEGRPDKRIIPTELLE